MFKFDLTTLKLENSLFMNDPIVHPMQPKPSRGPYNKKKKVFREARVTLIPHYQNKTTKKDIYLPLDSFPVAFDIVRRGNLPSIILERGVLNLH